MKQNGSNLLPITQDLDFHYLLALMPALQDTPEFAWLPELYSTIGHESLIKLCRYCGGETIKIPTLDQLDRSTTSLQWYYDVFISKKLKFSDIPEEYKEPVCQIRGILNAGNNKS